MHNYILIADGGDTTVKDESMINSEAKREEPMEIEQQEYERVNEDDGENGYETAIEDVEEDGYETAIEDVGEDGYETASEEQCWVKCEVQNEKRRDMDKDITHQVKGCGTRTAELHAKKPSFFVMGAERENTYYLKGRFDRNEPMMLLDTDCTHSVMPWSLYTALTEDSETGWTQSTTKEFLAAIAIQGVASVKMKIGDRTFILDFQIADIYGKVLLGMDFWMSID